jgi:hypothetical protein
VGGNCYNAIGGGINRDIARFNGTSWTQVGLGLFGGDSNITDMIVYNGELYVCGYFRLSAGNAGNKIMRWDGLTWNDVGEGLCSATSILEDMMVHDGKLFVVGVFDCIGNGVPARNIATWDGERWCSFGNSTFDNKISGIAEYKGEIYIGGGFTKVDDQPCSYFAKYIGDHSNDTCSAPVSAAPEPDKNGFKLSPNPSSDLLEIQAPAPIESVWIYDAMGRAVLQPGVFGLRTSVSVGDLPAGLYFVSVRAGGRSWSGKFVRQ